MTLGILIMVAGASAFAIIWLLNYAPLIRKNVLGGYWSPRLTLCKILIPFDIGITMFLIVGSILGLGAAVTGIQMLVYNVFVGVGVSAGVYIANRWIIPRWRRTYNQRLNICEVDGYTNKQIQERWERK